MTHVATETALPELLESVAALRDGEVGPRSLAVLESTVGHGEMSPLHAHDEDEAFRVLEGVLVMHIGAETTRLEPGESIVAPSGVPHALGADSDARYLTTTFARSIRLYEDFVRAVGRPDPDAPSEDAAVVAAIGQANGIVVLGPPGVLPS